VFSTSHYGVERFGCATAKHDDSAPTSHMSNLNYAEVASATTAAGGFRRDAF